MAQAEEWVPKKEENSTPEWTPPEDKNLVDKASEYLVKHPRIREIATKLLNGSEPHQFTKEEADFINSKSQGKDIFGTPYKQVKEGDKQETLGPGLTKIPGTDKLAESIRAKGRNTGNYWGGFASSLLGDVVDAAGSGFDPRTASTEKIPFKMGEVVPEEGLPITRADRQLGSGKIYTSEKGSAYSGETPIRRSSEVSYKSPESFTTAYGSNRPPVKRIIRGFLPEQTQTAVEDSTLSVRAARELPPDMIAKGDEDLFNSIRKGETKNPEDILYETAKAKMGGTQKEEEIVPQEEITPKNNEQIQEWTPSEARTEGGKLAIGADIRSLGKILGTSLYKGDIAPIATKELLQNSVDAVRHLTGNGNIDVVLNHEDKSISVKDNGKGLTKQQLETVFTDLGASGKRDEESASGGFGLAKASFLLGSKKVEVTSIARDPKSGKLIESRFEGTPDDLMSGVDIHQREVHSENPTGTHVKVFVPEKSSMYYPQDFVRAMAKNSHGLQSNIRLGESYTSGKAPINMETLPKAEGKILTTLNNPTATTKLIIPKDAEYRTSSHMRLNLSNNGMYQGGKSMFFPNEVPNVPSEVTVDISPKVPEGHADYPFTANREELRGTVDADIQKYIKDNIIEPSFEARKAEIQKLYNSMPEITVGEGEFPNTFGRKIVVYDPKGQITAPEMKTITSSPAFKDIANDIGQILDEILKTSPKMAQSLEKVGIIFQDGLHGIRIPNPGTKDAAILINPFQIIGTDSPDVASASLLHTMLHEAAHLDVGAHNESFTIKLGDIYGKFGARRTVEAQDQILKSIADPNTGIYHPEIQKLLQIYKESRGREGTTEDLLSGTGIKQAVRGKGSEGVPSNNQSNGKGDATKSALDKLFSALGNISEKRVEQDILNRTERSRRFAEFSSVKEEGVKGAKKSLSTLKGEYESVDIDKLKLSRAETDTLFTAVKRAKISPGEKARGYTAMFKLLNGELPQRNELRLLDDVFGNGFAERITELHGGLGAVGLNLSKAANTMKAMTSSIDLSGPLRQGLPLIHRPEYRDAFGEMFKYLAKPEYYKAAMEALEERPYYLLGREAGLFLSKPDTFLKSEEAFANSYVHHLPDIISKPVDASERAYTGFLNKLRADTFDNLIKQARAAGHEAFTVEETENGKVIVPSKVAENIAKYVNNSTGRGSLGRLDKYAEDLNTVLWSPRFIASRFNMLNPKYYTAMDPFTKKQAIKSLLAIAAAGTTMIGLAKLSGASVSLDPTSSDFMKARFGKHVLDPWAGFQQPLVAAAKMIKELNRMYSGRKPKFNEDNILTIGTNFARNKESPMASLADSILSAKMFTGDKKEGDITSLAIPQYGGYTDRFGKKKYLNTEVAKKFTSMFIQDMTELLSDNPSFAEIVGLGGLSLFGAGIQDYPESTNNSGLGQLRIR